MSRKESTRNQELKNRLAALERKLGANRRVTILFRQLYLEAEQALHEARADIKKWEPYSALVAADNIGAWVTMTKLMEFLKATAGSETPMMSEFGIAAKDGEKVHMIRLWASHGKTPVDRAAELVAERDRARAELKQTQADLATARRIICELQHQVEGGGPFPFAATVEKPAPTNQPETFKGMGSESIPALLHRLRELSDLVPTKGVKDVLTERRRQIEKEGFDTKHDEQDGVWYPPVLVSAAVCYLRLYKRKAWMLDGATDNERKKHHESECPPEWPWEKSWWKPKNPRRDLVRACALILAEIDLIDARRPKP